MAGGLHTDSDDVDEQHEINVTPLIDVMLVLLIIFMVAAPLSTVDVAVDLPVSTAKAQPRPDKPLFLTIKADRTLALDNDAIERQSLAAGLDASTSSNRNTAHLPESRPIGGVRRGDARDEPAAGGRLFESRFDGHRGDRERVFFRRRPSGHGVSR